MAVDQRCERREDSLPERARRGRERESASEHFTLLPISRQGSEEEESRLGLWETGQDPGLASPSQHMSRNGCTVSSVWAHRIQLSPQEASAPSGEAQKEAWESQPPHPERHRSTTHPPIPRGVLLLRSSHPLSSVPGKALPLKWPSKCSRETTHPVRPVCTCIRVCGDGESPSELRVCVRAHVCVCL